VDPSSPGQSSNSPINGLNLDGIEPGLSAYLLKKWWQIVAAIVATIAIIVALLRINQSPVVGLIPIIAFWLYLQSAYEGSLFKAFAKANGYNFRQSGDIGNQTGLLFSIGDNRGASEIVSGNYRQWDFLLFKYDYSSGIGQNRGISTHTVMAVNFHTTLPAFVLRRPHKLQLLEEEGESLTKSGYTEKVKLEGDFDKHFEVYIPPNSQVAALSILTPDVMQTLIALDKYEIEMTINGVLYIYCHGQINKKQQLIDLYTILRSVIQTITPYVNRQQQLPTAQP